LNTANAELLINESEWSRGEGEEEEEEEEEEKEVEESGPLNSRRIRKEKLFRDKCWIAMG